MAQLTEDAAKRMTMGYENYIDHLYLDGEGHLTVGYGTKFERGEEDSVAYTVRFFKDEDKKSIASIEDVVHEISHLRNKYAGNVQASYYSRNKIVKLRAEDYTLQRLFQDRYANAKRLAAEWYNERADGEQVVGGAKIVNPDFNSLHPNIRYALTDMAYQMNGGRKVNPRKGLIKFKSLKKALKIGDYETAARESIRPQAQGDRNLMTHELILSPKHDSVKIR